jgi:FixJ family two-component response regulator
LIILVQNALQHLIAIIDDDAFARDGMTALVESLGYVSARFASTEEYLASNIVVETACLVLDVHLPGMNGPDLQANLLADGYRIPIIFVTGQFDDRTRAKVSRAGAIAYLAKPCCEKMLVSCLDRALGRVISG